MDVDVDHLESDHATRGGPLSRPRRTGRHRGPDHPPSSPPFIRPGPTGPCTGRHHGPTLPPSSPPFTRTRDNPLHRTERHPPPSAPNGRRLARGVVRKAAAIALVASALAISPAAASGQAVVNTVQSPPNPVPFGQDVTLTITVTNSGPEAFPSRNEDTVLSLFVLRAQSDRAAPNTYTSVTRADGQPCVPTAAKVPFVDCDLTGFPAGATATYTAVINAQVSVDQFISVEACRVDCSQLGQGDITTIVGCGVPALAGKLVTDARWRRRTAPWARSRGGRRPSASAVASSRRRPRRAHNCRPARRSRWFSGAASRARRRARRCGPARCCGRARRSRGPRRDRASGSSARPPARRR
jgi:hypothetical protein